MASPQPTAQSRSLYERDPHAWAEQQADALKAGRLHDLDLENLAEEIAEMGRGERKELRSELSIILVHMLKWDHQSSHRSKSWINSIDEHRDRVEVSLEDSPSLKVHLDEILVSAYKIARRTAARETNIPEAQFPTSLPYRMSDILTRKFDLSKGKDPR